MKENKKIQVSLTGLIFLIVFIAVIVGGSVYLFTNYDLKIMNKKELQELVETENEEMEDINNLSKENAEKKAKEVLDKWMDLQHFENGGIGPAPYIFVKLGLMSEKEVLTLEQNLLDTDPSIYIKSNIEYKKFKDALLNYVTEEYFEKNFSHYTNMDGYVGFCSTAGGIVVTEVEKVTLNKVEENKYIFNVILKDVQVYEHYLNPEEGENITEEDYLFNIDIEFKFIDGKMLINKVSDVIKNNEETDIEKECKRAFESFFDLREELVSGGSLYVLELLGLVSTPNDKQYETITYEFDDFYKTDIKYSDFKKAIEKYVTEEFLKKEFEEKYVKNIDGYLHITAMGGTAKYIDIEKFELSSNNENLYIFNLAGEQRYDDGAPKETVRIKVTFEKENENYIISEVEYI